MSTAILFSPQGSQAVGMGAELARLSAAAADTFAAANAALGWDVAALCWRGPQEQLDDTRRTQPCLVATSVACYGALAERVSINAAMVAGHSVGEYAALVAAGVLDFDDALRLVARRGELMADRAGGSMVAVLGLERRAVADALRASGDGVVVANDNAPGQVVISGSREAVDGASASLRAAGARRLLPLRVSGAFHSPLMEPVADALREAFASVTWRDAQPPVVSNVTAQPLRDAETIRETLAEQVRSPVEWVRSIDRMVAEGVDTFVECGPGGVLAGMVRRIAPQATALSVADAAGLEAAAAALDTARVPA